MLQLNVVPEYDTLKLPVFPMGADPPNADVMSLLAWYCGMLPFWNKLVVMMLGDLHAVHGAADTGRGWSARRVLPGPAW